MEEVCRQRARQLLEELQIRDLPVDVEDIARRCGLEIEYISKGKGFNGQLLKEKRVIQVQADHHHHRKRFTIAHEIGHYILDHNPVVCSLDERSLRDPRKINEKQAQIFASELLMPEQWVKNYCSLMKSDFRAMARKFFVSDEAMFHRLQDANLLGLDSPI
jgi:Zn-dependent peptidase ImmA (M78 family)